ncbi:hypothetical protein GGR42_001890 [Saonia flava]|uniref:DUF4097 domain-containing protein n=1 Tax=Saonia flava TaxID=523696 RepID=A0A846QTQ2_9FLAO|nr:DUF4097 domain-containing protein [Saonia flava]NJB71428.1 hypothetical protein [Saonia flava]
MKQVLLCAAFMTLMGTQVAKSQKKESKEQIKKEHSFDSSSKENKLIIKNVFGSITVEGYDGDQVLFSVEKTISAESNENLELGKRELQLKVFKKGNLIIAHPDAPYISFNEGRLKFDWCNDNDYDEPGYDHHMNFSVKVPKNIKVEVSTINDGEVLVKNTRGDFIKANNINGGITLERITGQTDVHCINGEVNISYVDNPSASSTYYSLNGDINITYQKDLSADVAFKSMNGEMFTDFDIAKQYTKTSKNEEGNKKKGKYKYEARPMVQIGKGGIDFDFETLNGNVFIKKI